jgi:similar to stage IV sporulation protein
MRYHFYNICVEKKSFYEIINGCKGLPLRNIVEEEQGVLFDVDAKDLKILSNFLEAEQIKPLQFVEKGVKTKVGFSLLKVVCCSVLVMSLGLFLCSGYIWNISVEGNYSYSEEQLKSFLKQNDLMEGVKKSTVDCGKIENLIRGQYSDISWVSCEIKGTNLMIHMKENYIAEISAKETKPYHLIANVSGTITSIITRSGRAAVKAGDQVKKGDLLISGKIEVQNEFDEAVWEGYCMADGDIQAKVVHHYKDSVEKKQVQIPYESSRNYTFPFPVSMILQFGKEKNHYVEHRSEPIALFEHYYLPLQMHHYTVFREEPKIRELTSREAEKILRHKMLYYFVQLEQKGYKILKKDVKMVTVKSKYCLQGKYVCIEPVGKVEYIDLKKEEKESSTNERNR